MNSEELYEVLRNEAKVKVGEWNEEVKEMFVKCVFEGVSVEYCSYKNKWGSVLPDFYERPAIYLKPSTKNILRVLF